MRILVFGDSITQGYWGVEGGWVERLRKHYDGVQFSDLRNNDQPTIFNLGISADNSVDIVSRIKNETKARIRHNNKAIVMVQIGANDASISHESMTVSVEVSTYRKNLVQIISELQTVPAKIIFVGSSACDESKTVPVFWNDIDYTNDRIKLYEDTMQQVAKEQKIDFIPIFDRFKTALDAGKDLLADGLHPNDKGHQLIADCVKPELEVIIEK